MKIDLKEMFERMTFIKPTTCIVPQGLERPLIIFDGDGQLVRYVVEVLNKMQKRLDRELDNYAQIPIPEPFIPDMGDDYYFISHNSNEIYYREDFCGTTDILRAKLGNCFKTEEELQRLTPSQRQSLWDKFYKLGE